ncbi:hypothetical protein KSP40_PGU008746 [Platanthera guangdongensis]|uniref:Uncharacterized protein n=1 Tax=Platanthera guangdongensis TaxID=2320717 RepID=A0ABR2M084_9ASPA
MEEAGETLDNISVKVVGDKSAGEKPSDEGPAGESSRPKKKKKKGQVRQARPIDEEPSIAYPNS